MLDHAIMLIIALVLDWFIGDPDWLWCRFPHPVVAFGKAVGFLEDKLNVYKSGNNTDAENRARVRRKGAVAIALLIIAAIFIALAFEWLIGLSKIAGWALEILIIWVFLAQKSLRDHVGAVAAGLRQNGLKQKGLGQNSLEKGRKAVALIVGRDPQSLDESGVARAAIESLAENFCDGVVAPVFWYLIFGLPGLFAYKMINTADSMIAYKNERYLDFGRVAAKIDDLANWLPARLSALLIATASGLMFGLNRGIEALKTAMRDAGLHASPNAGWPEAAMAAACNIALGGPRLYGGKKVSQAFINGAGKLGLGASDIETAMAVFSVSCYVLWGAVGAVLLIFIILS